MKFKLALLALVILFCSCGFLKEKLQSGMQKNSPETKAISSLKTDVLVKVFISKNLPEPYKNLYSDVKKLLEKYESASGKFRYEIIDPMGESGSENSKLKEEAKSYGIEEVSVQTQDKNSMSVFKAYVGAVIISGDKNLKIKTFDSFESFQAQLLSKITRISSSNNKIAFLTGHDELQYSKLPKIKSALSHMFDVQSVNLSKGESISPNIAVLIVAAPKEKFKESELFLLDQYIMRGGKIIWMINKIIPNFDDQIVKGEKLNLNLDDFFANYGVKINDDLVRDMQCSSVQVESSTGIPVSVKYPYFPTITSIDTSIGIFKNIQSITLTFVSTVVQVSTSDKIKMRTLLMTSENSGIGEDKSFVVLNLEQFQEMSKSDAAKLFNKGPQRVGALFSGSYKSFFAGRQAPLPVLGDVLNESAKNSTMIVIGDGDMINEENRPPEENLTFFVDMIEYLSDSE
jgi:gliding-associated putative ABC transporter substrate-binding component GldG